MTIPIILSWPQLFLLLIGVLGLGLLISSIMSLGSRELTTYKDEAGVRTYRRRRVRWGRGISGVLLLALALSLLWAIFTIQTYLGLTGEIKVASVRATTIANVPHQMSVELILYNGAGHPASNNTYLIKGDEWMLQGDIVKLPAWLNVIGLHSGYKLTRLEGRYDDIKLENTAQHTATELNGGDDTFFKTTYAQKSWLSWFVDASYGNAVFQAPGTFDVFATQDALIARPAR